MCPFLDDQRRFFVVFFFLYSLFLTWLGAVPGHCASARRSGEETQVRIAIVKNAESVELKARGRYQLRDALSGEELQSGRRLKRTRVTAGRQTVRFGAREYRRTKLVIQSEKPITVLFKNKKRQYRGTITIQWVEGQRLLLINTLGMEEYIRGVLYHEVSHRWPLAAIKAQAVAARSYAVYQVRQRHKADYDVSSDIYSQVYGGRDSERYRTNIAVERTEGEILTFEGEILPTYYHATCAGHTEDVEELWKHDLFALKGVACPFCLLAPHYAWEKNLQLQNIQESLNDHDYQLDLIKDIRVVSRNKSGRINNLEITTRTGKQVTIAGKEFRNIVGPNVIKSNNYRIRMKGYYVDFIGRGWGHGVGMCQWGAMEMARQRYSYRDILFYYYPGSRIQQGSALLSASE